ncbi:MAG TPA: phosphoenolpyruvate--protein phosphotransferase [Alphaproteobacteria bacterium]|jgi:phosphotransferase system enzyme I (PtsP)|nr:phosphoenolpyruvate--protein phosphotransferase [Alphaproteobacteria bacterium]
MPEAIVLTASRRLLRNLRDVMAAPGSAQQRLDKVVKLIASNLVAEVCSIYGLRAGEVLELFATEGLNPDAVHKTRLRVGEGLVGDIAAHARPLALSDAQAHPLFAYRPETGEEIYHSLMGVPILRSGKVIGVVVVQNRTRRHYTDEEVETLQTIAMVLAELVAGSGLVSSDELKQADGIGLLPLRLEGLCFNPGIAMGLAVMHQPRIAVNRLVAEDPAGELRRLREAVKGMHSALDDLLAADDLAHSGEHRDVLEAYRMIAEDRGWLRRIREAIRSGLTAEAAVQRVQEDMRARMGQVTDPYIRERLQDFEDVTNRVLQHLTGYQDTAARQELPEDVVLIARNMGPAELLDYDRRRLRALLLEEGAAHAHVAIVARALEIPVLGRLRGLLERVEANDLVIVDGDHAQVFVRPGEDVQQIFAQSFETRKQRQRAYARLRDLPAVTRDGVAVSLQLNAGLLMDVENLKESGADGIGLYRTEIPFMVRPHFPNLAEQTEFYRKALELAGDRTVVFRTLDVGGDKVLPYFPKSEDENPAMGWRAIRISLDRPAILRQQLRALLRAHGDRPLSVMFPMIAEVAEFDAARAIVDIELELARRQKRPVPRVLRVGAMLEVPALAWQMPALLSRVDFLSVGSNDLFQFLFASDRGNPRIAERYDVLSPAVLGFLRDVVSRCAAKQVPITVCGEMAGRPLEAMVLIGLGFRSLSMTSNSLGPVKEMVRSLDLADLRDYLAMLESSADHSLRGKLGTYARDHGVAI